MSAALNDASDIRLGATQVDAVYLGDTELWTAGGGAPLHVWLVAEYTVTGGAFDDVAAEACATGLEARGYTVTRLFSGSVSAAPTTTDCDVLIHLNGGGGPEDLPRAITAGAAPVIAVHTYWLANTFGHAALASGPTGVNAGDTQFEILNNTDIIWTDGHAVNDLVTAWSSWRYLERVQGVVAGAIPFARTPTNDYEVGYLFPAGTTNLAGQTTVARVAVFNLFTDFGSHFTTAGWQMLDDVIAWAVA